MLHQEDTLEFKDLRLRGGMYDGNIPHHGLQLSEAEKKDIHVVGYFFFFFIIPLVHSILDPVAIPTSKSLQGMYIGS